MTIPTQPDRLTLTCTTVSLRDKILELHSNDWTIESLVPTTDGKVRLVAKKLLPGMLIQTYNDIDMQDFWFRFAQMRDFKIRESKGSPHSEK